MWTRREGPLNGRLRRKRSLIRLKMAVLSPMPSASVTIAMKVNAGDWRSLRKAKRRSVMEVLFHSKCLDRIDHCGAARWKITRGQRGTPEQESHAAEDQRIAWVDSVK